MSDKKLWRVYCRAHLRKGERKIVMHRYLVVAVSIEQAVDMACNDNYLHIDGRWSGDAEPIDDPPVYTVGRVHDEPTDDELEYAGRKRRASP